MIIFTHLCPLPAYLQVSGEDAQSYLQSQLSIDLVSMEPYDIRFGLRLNKKGKTQAGMYVIKSDEETFSLLSRGTSGLDLIALMEENIVADDIEFCDQSTEYDLVTVYGPNAEEIFKILNLTCPPEKKVLQNEEITAFLDSRLKNKTYTLLVPKKNTILENVHISFTDQSEIEDARIRSGLVAIPNEIGPDELPQEGGLEKECVDFQKGCYLGQEVMARIHAMGKVRRQTLPVEFESSTPPILPTPIFHDQKKVGLLKSFIKGVHGYVGIAIIHENGINALREGKIKMQGNTSKFKLYEPK